MALPLGASTVIDVSANAVQVLNPGDALLFSFSASNFIADTRLFGLPAYPVRVQFTFVSAEVSGAGQFSANLSTADGGFAIPFLGPLSFVPANFQSAEYDGPTSAISGSLALSANASQELFGGGSSAILTLQNEGPTAVRVGLAGYTLTQDLNGTLSGGGLMVGTWATGTDYLDPPPVPEPSSEALMLAGGALLCALSLALKRMRRQQHPIE